MGWISQYLPHIGGVWTFWHHKSYPKGWIRKSTTLAKLLLTKSPSAGLLVGWFIAKTLVGMMMMRREEVGRVNIY